VELTIKFFDANLCRFDRIAYSDRQVTTDRRTHAYVTTKNRASA